MARRRSDHDRDEEALHLLSIVWVITSRTNRRKRSSVRGGRRVKWISISFGGHAPFRFDRKPLLLPFVVVVCGPAVGARVTKQLRSTARVRRVRRVTFLGGRKSKEITTKTRVGDSIIRVVRPFPRRNKTSKYRIE